MEQETSLLITQILALWGAVLSTLVAAWQFRESLRQDERYQQQSPVVLAPIRERNRPDFPTSIERYTIRIRLHVVRNSFFLAAPISYRNIDYIGVRPFRI